MQPPKGVNVSVDTLFSDDIRDPIERTKRVETAVVELRRDLDSAMPAIKRLVAVEKDIQLLTSQLETLLNGEPPPPEDMSVSETIAVMPANPVPLVPAVPEKSAVETDARPQAPPLEKPPMEESMEPIVANGEVSGEIYNDEVTDESFFAPEPLLPEADQAAPEPAVPETKSVAAEPKSAPAKTGADPMPAVAGINGLGLRAGDHGDKTRLVIDLSGKATYRADLDNDEHLLVIELEDAGWSGNQTREFKSPVLQSFSTQPLENGKGTRLILVLKKDTAILYQGLMPPDQETENTRLVIDVKN